MHKNYGINIFDYESPQSLTHTVEYLLFSSFFLEKFTFTLEKFK